MRNKESTEPSFTQRSFKALKWNYLGSISRSGLQFLIGILLARLLGPQPFGLVAVGITVMGLGSLISEFGLGSALVQREKITDKDIRFVFTIQFTIGVALTTAVFMLAGPIGRFFHEPDAVIVVQAMSPLFLIASAGQTASALLRRNLNFKASQLAQFGSYSIGYILLGIPLALAGLGVWSLVIAQMTQATLNSIALYCIVRHPVTPCFKSSSSGLCDFGLKITASNLSSWGFTSVDNIVIGRAFSVTDMGLYNRASILMSTPAGIVVTSMQSVLFSTIARKQNDIPALRRTYLAVLSAMAFVCFPVFFAVAAVPDTVLNGIYGTKWASAAPLLLPLALLQPAFALLALGSSVITGVGKAGQEMWVQFLALSFFSAALWLASGFSVEVIAWAAMATYWLRLVMITAVTLRLVQGEWSSVTASLAGPAVLGILVAGATYAANAIAGIYSTSPLTQLLIVTFAGAVMTVFLFILLRSRLVTPPAAWLFEEVGARLPKPFRYFLQGSRASRFPG